jgi:hypothetical protein
MRKREGDAITEYPIDPTQVAVALAARVSFDTGLLSGNTLLVRTEGVKKTVIEYRKAQKTGVYLDGSETALRVPLPGLLMIRTTSEDRNPSYAVYAVNTEYIAYDIRDMLDRSGCCLTEWRLGQSSHESSRWILPCAWGHRRRNEW